MISELEVFAQDYPWDKVSERSRLDELENKRSELEVRQRCKAEYRIWVKAHPWWWLKHLHEYIFLPFQIIYSLVLEPIFKWLSKEDNQQGCLMLLLALLIGMSPGPDEHR